MIDVTLVSIYAKPHYFGKSWYNQKPNYSINVQIMNASNLKIFDYIFGFLESRYNVHYVYFTGLIQELRFFL